jgi:hypothetical protein
VTTFTKRVARADVVSTLSMLWVYVLLNILFRDVHELFRPGFVEELLTRDFDPMTVFFGGLAIQLPLALIVLTRLLRRRSARITNISAAAMTALVTVSTWPKDADDLMFSTFELLGLVVIVMVAVRWPESQQEAKR